MFNKIKQVKNSPTSVRHLLVKMYAELAIKKNRKSQGIKSLWDNRLKIYFMGAMGSSNNRLHGKLSAIAS